MKQKIIHIMADGTKRESVENLIVPLTDKTESAYKILKGVKAS